MGQCQLYKPIYIITLYIFKGTAVSLKGHLLNK